MNQAKGLGLFAFFYLCAWLGWFAAFSAGQFAHLPDYFVQGLSGESGLPLLLQVLALGTAIISTWTLRALQDLDWF